MIKQDVISITLTSLAVMMLLFLSTFGQDLMLRSVFAVSLIVAGVVLARMTKTYDEDDDVSWMDLKYTFQYVVMSLGVIMLLSMVVPKISLSIDTSQLSSSDLFLVPKMFGVLIAVSEETFFRLYATNYFILKSGSLSLGLISSGLLFGVYHLAVYGTNPNLMIYVTGAGILLSYVAFKTQRVSTTMIAHVIINALAG